MKKLGILVIIALPLVFVFSCGKARAQTFSGLHTTHFAKVALASQASTTPEASLVAKGRTRYLDYKCDECHGANGEGGGDGPDLIGTRLNADQISKFLEKPSPDAYMKGMPNIPANHPDNQALVAYVLSLKKVAKPEERSAQPPPAPSEEQKKSDPPVAHKLSAAEKAHVLDGEFTIEKNVARLPDSLKSAFANLAKEDDFDMANPGEKYQEGDVISSGPRLPWRRLIFAGISKDRYFIHYEQGGMGRSFHLAIFEVGPDGKVSFLFGGSGIRAAKDLAHLRSAVLAKQFADGNDYW